LLTFRFMSLKCMDCLTIYRTRTSCNRASLHQLMTGSTSIRYTKFEYRLLPVRLAALEVSF
jgi:hypothetical protein